MQHHPACGRMIYPHAIDPKRSSMCGRYSLICIDDLGNRFRIFDPIMGLRSRFNVAPASEMPVVVRSDRNHLAIMRWGLIPRWTKDARSAKPLINARAETLAEKPAFRALLSTHRCLVPASGFYEWKKEGKRKIPHYIRVSDSPLFSFAGLCDEWCIPGGDTVRTFTIVTCEANHLVEPLHDRMPVILTRQGEERWLDPCPIPSGELKTILAPYPAGLMEAVPVSDRVNSPAADDERLVQPLDSHNGVQTSL